MRVIRIGQARNPWLILLFLPLVLAVLFVIAMIMLGSLAVRRLKRIGDRGEVNRRASVENSSGVKFDKNGAIEAEYRTLPR